MSQGVNINMRKRMYKCSNPACGVMMDERKAMSRGNGCKCGGKKPRILRCPICGGILNRVDRPETEQAKGNTIKSYKVGE